MCVELDLHGCVGKPHASICGGKDKIVFSHEIGDFSHEIGENRLSMVDIDALVC